VSDVVLREAWRKGDPSIERDAELFWRANRALPHGVDVGNRLSELCAAAYVDGQPLAISTSSIRNVDFLRTRLAMYRVFVSPDARVAKVASKLTLFSRDVLEDWSREHQREVVMGMGAVIQSRALVKNDRAAVWPDSKLTFVGYTQEGYQMRVYWFAHATVSTYWPGEESESPVKDVRGAFGSGRSIADHE